MKGVVADNAIRVSHGNSKKKRKNRSVATRQIHKTSLASHFGIDSIRSCVGVACIAHWNSKNVFKLLTIQKNGCEHFPN